MSERFKTTSRTRDVTSKHLNYKTCAVPTPSKEQPTGACCLRKLLTLPVVVSLTVLVVAFPAHLGLAAMFVERMSSDEIQAEARRRYAAEDFSTATEMLTELLRRQPAVERWREMRAQVLVDNKSFEEALQDFNVALDLTPSSDAFSRARLLSGRALAYEGLALWGPALADYDESLHLAVDAGSSADPYVLNSRGNVHASLGQWAEARADYLSSAAGFQGAKGFRGRGGSTTLRLDGAVFASSNAALMLVQLGDDGRAIKEMERVARRAPGSADMRAALAALYWGQGMQSEAEAEWQFACDYISVGCTAYQDTHWLATIRRWPPRMVDKMTDFLALKPPQNISIAKPSLIE